jgi:hypothetical protein
VKLSFNGTTGKLPPWTGDDRAMLLWLGERLSAISEEEEWREIVRENTNKINDHHDLAIKWARHGMIEPLRKLYPDIAEFIHLPKRKRGQRFPNLFAHLSPVLRAALDARRIRALWKKFYPGRRRRRDDKSAEDFAAELWTNRLKTSRQNFGRVFEDQDRRPVEIITTRKVINRLKKTRPSK